jgi:hypothetical protein
MDPESTTTIFPSPFSTAAVPGSGMGKNQDPDPQLLLFKNLKNCSHP